MVPFIRSVKAFLRCTEKPVYKKSEGTLFTEGFFSESFSAFNSQRANFQIFLSYEHFCNFFL